MLIEKNYKSGVIRVVDGEISLAFEYSDGPKTFEEAERLIAAKRAELAALKARIEQVGPTDAELDAAVSAMELIMFADHELPVTDEYVKGKLRQTAIAALEAAKRVAARRGEAPEETSCVR